MKLQTLIVILVIVLTSACVSTRPAKTLTKAERRIVQYHKGIQNQIDAFPSLVDKAAVRKEIIKVRFPEDSVKIHLLLQDIQQLNLVTADYKAKYDSVNYSLRQVNNYLDDYSVDLNTRRPEIKQLVNKVKQLNAENKQLFQQYRKLASLPQSGKYEDERFIVNYRFDNGMFVTDIISKEQEVQKEVPVAEYNIDIRRHFWQDIKFWAFLIALLNVFYFFNSLIYSFLSSIFTAIKVFVRRIIKL